MVNEDIPVGLDRKARYILRTDGRIVCTASDHDTAFRKGVHILGAAWDGDKWHDHDLTIDSPSGLPLCLHVGADTHGEVVMTGTDGHKAYPLDRFLYPDTASSYPLGYGVSLFIVGVGTRVVWPDRPILSRKEARLWCAAKKKEHDAYVADLVCCRDLGSGNLERITPLDDGRIESVRIIGRLEDDGMGCDDLDEDGMEYDVFAYGFVDGDTGEVRHAGVVRQ